MKSAWSRCSTCLSGAHPETVGRVSDLLQGLMQIGLSPREIECVRLRAEDLRYEEIAVRAGAACGHRRRLTRQGARKDPEGRERGVRKNCDLAQAVAREKRYAS